MRATSRRQSDTLARTRDLATVASYSARVRALLEEAEGVAVALDRLGKARVRGAFYALDCLGESTNARQRRLRSQESLVAVDEALREVIDRPGFEPAVLAESA